jgi:type II secretory pathway component GspD/PulD (secretin)
MRWGSDKDQEFTSCQRFSEGEVRRRHAVQAAVSAAVVRIIADTVNNTVLVYSNRDDHRVIERALHDFDRPRLQVAIEATVAEVTLTNESESVVESRTHSLAAISLVAGDCRS